MKKLMVIALCSVFMVVAFASMAMATQIGYLSGNENAYLTGWDIDGNSVGGLVVGAEALFTTENDVSIANDWLDSDPITTYFLSKLNQDGDWGDGLDVGFGISGGNPGTWSAPAGYTVDYVTVKAGNGFNIFDTADNNWITPFQKDLSHISFWGSQDPTIPPGTPPVPEPATVVLLGFGLIGLAAVGRRQMKK